MGHEVARSTIANILKTVRSRCPSVTGRPPGKEFLSQHRERIVPADFLTIAAWTGRGLTRFLVLFLIDLSSRRVEIAGLARQANGLWMSKVARNLSDATDGFLVGKRYLIHDRDPRFTAEFLQTRECLGVEAVKLPPRTPNLNAQPERLVRTLQETCWERLVLFGEGALRRAIHDFVLHYHHERNRRGLDNQLIMKEESYAGRTGAVQRRPRLGGRLNISIAQRLEGGGTNCKGMVTGECVDSNRRTVHERSLG